MQHLPTQNLYPPKFIPWPYFAVCQDLSPLGTFFGD